MYISEISGKQSHCKNLTPCVVLKVNQKENV